MAEGVAEGVAVDVFQADLQKCRSIDALITANNLDAIRSLLNPLTLRHRQSIVCQTLSNKTLLGHACRLGYRDIVKYLLDECEADISERYVHRQISLSPLRVSIDNLDVSMLLLLMRRGVVNIDELEAINCSTYAFNNKYFSIESILKHYIYRIKPNDSSLFPVRSFLNYVNVNAESNHIADASARGDIEKIKVLLAYGIDTKGRNIFEENALCMAILNEEKNAEHFLMNYKVFSPKDHVQALELSGAKFIAFQSDLEKGLRCWRKSLRIRKQHLFGVLDKFETDLGFQFSCKEELDILADHDADLFTQALIVFTRLLSPRSYVVQNAFVTVAQHPVFRNDLKRAIMILAQLFQFRSTPGRVYVYHGQLALETALFLFRKHFDNDTLDRGNFKFKFKSLINFINEMDWDVVLSTRSQFYHLLYVQLLMILLWKIIAMKDFDLCKNDKVWIKGGVSRILQFQSDPYPTTLLHLSIEDRSTSSIIPFLLTCSADANCTDNEKNTPMHSVSLLAIDDSHRLHLLNLLADWGGHIDAVNCRDTTPFKNLRHIASFKNPLRYMSLQCLAAQTIHNYKIEVPEFYPKILVSFIKLHSC